MIDIYGVIAEPVKTHFLFSRLREDGSDENYIKWGRGLGLAVTFWIMNQGPHEAAIQFVCFRAMFRDEEGAQTPITDRLFKLALHSATDPSERAWVMPPELVEKLDLEEYAEKLAYFKDCVENMRAETVSEPLAGQSIN